MNKVVSTLTLTLTVLYFGVLLTLDLVHCWLVLCFTVPTQLKALWLYGDVACMPRPS
jgi:hypothetical protein